MNPFETETMADLCVRQGHRTEALAIYRRLLLRSADATARARLARRIAALDDTGAPPSLVSPPEAPISEPGVRARWSNDQLTIEWRLPVELAAPGLEVLLVKAGPSGISTERRAIAVRENAGHLTLPAKGLHSARVAAGSRGPDGFVPVARG